MSTNPGNFPLLVIYFYTKGNTNELITTFPTPKQKIRKDERNHIKYKRGSCQSFSEKEMEKQNK